MAWVETVAFGVQGTSVLVWVLLQCLQSLCQQRGCQPCLVGVAGSTLVQTGAQAAGEAKINPGIITSPKSFLSPLPCTGKRCFSNSMSGLCFFFPPESAGLGTARGFVTAQQSCRRGWHLLFSGECLNLGQEYVSFSNPSGARWNPASLLLS